MKQLGALIESGQAAELLKASGSTETSGDATEEEGLGPRRDAGTTTRLRKARNADDSSEVDASLSPDEAPALPAAEVDSESPQKESSADGDSSESDGAAASVETASESDEVPASDAASGEDDTSSQDSEAVADEESVSEG